MAFWEGGPCAGPRPEAYACKKVIKKGEGRRMGGTEVAESLGPCRIPSVCGTYNGNFLGFGSGTFFSFRDNCPFVEECSPYLLHMQRNES